MPAHQRPVAERSAQWCSKTIKKYLKNEHHKRPHYLTVQRDVQDLEEWCRIFNAKQPKRKTGHQASIDAIKRAYAKELKEAAEVGEIAARLEQQNKEEAEREASLKRKKGKNKLNVKLNVRLE